MTGIPLQIHIGEGLQAAGQLVIAAWKRAENGDDVPERHVGFETYAGFARTVTPKRLELAKCLRQNGAMSVRALSLLLKRDYKSVHSDVQILFGAGLVDKTDEGLVEVTWDKINADFDLLAA